MNGEVYPGNRRMTQLHPQAAVIRFRIRDERVEIALITTLSGKRWALPNGSLDECERSRDAGLMTDSGPAGART